MTKPMGVKVNAKTVINNIQKTLDLTQNFQPLFLEIVGKANDNRDWTLRGGILKSFISKMSPVGEPWTDLKPTYQTWKSKKYSGQPMLVRTGDMINSLIGSNQYSVNIMTNSKLVYGTNLDYAAIHQAGGGKIPKRAFIGWRDDQKDKIKSLIASYISQSLKGQKPSPGGD